MDALLLPFRWAYRAVVWLANSPGTLIVSYLVMIMIAGVLYSHFEQEGAGNSIWWAVVTATTVGYGDISPETWQARLLAALLISTMVLVVIPLITAHFASKLIVDRDAFRHEEQEELKGNLRAVRTLLEELAARQEAETHGATDGRSVSAAGSARPPPAPSGRSGTRPPSS